MTCYTGFLAPVPAANRQLYRAHVVEAWEILRRHGALRLVECWGVDVQKGVVNDLMGAVAARPDEVVVFSFVEWADRAAADRGYSGVGADPAMKTMAPMPFDGKRAIFGSFEPAFSGGSDRGAGYIQGFALAVPEKNRAAYVAMAGEAYEGAFRPAGCLGMVEGWGVDVPHGEVTDFWRATLAEPGEAVLFSWAAWPDKATCDAAAKAMEADMEGKEFPPMPFDGSRMMWGGFEVLFDSAG